MSGRMTVCENTFFMLCSLTVKPKNTKNFTKCLCNSPNCRGGLHGFSFHPVEIMNKYGDFIADYLKNQGKFIDTKE